LLRNTVIIQNLSDAHMVTMDAISYLGSLALPLSELLV
jgi:hypothetical protein